MIIGKDLKVQFGDLDLRWYSAIESRRVDAVAE